MISFETLSGIAAKQQTRLSNIVTDYIQVLFLYAFYRQKEAAGFFFKGGTALHLVFDSPRFSEDLDFSARAYDCRLFENLLNQTLVFIEKAGLKIEIIESKPTTGGCLAIFSAAADKFSARIQVEVSLRTPKKLRGESYLVKNEFMPPFEVQTAETAALAAGKIEALLARKKPRDFYDLYFMLRTGMVAKLSPEKRRLIINEVKKLNRRQLARELRQFLPRSHRLIFNDLPAVLLRELDQSYIKRQWD